MLGGGGGYKDTAPVIILSPATSLQCKKSVILKLLCNKNTPCSSLKLGKQLGKYVTQNTDIDILFC